MASIALYLGDQSLVKEIVEKTQRSLENQLDKTGGQVHELARTRSFFYSCFNLDVLTDMANIGSKVDLDMWHFEAEDKKSLSLAIDYLTPVIEGEAWTHPSQQGPDLSKLLPILIKISANTTAPKYDQLLNKTIKQLIDQEKTTGRKSKVLQELSLLNASSF